MRSTARLVNVLPKFKAEPTIVIDTNALIDVFSCHDLFGAYEKHGGMAAPIDHEELVYRRARAREAILLAVLLHHRRAISYTLREAWTQIMKRVKPPEEGEFPGVFTSMFVHFVQPVILGEWTAGMPHRRKKNEPTGSHADDVYVKYAKKNDISLISQEGYGPKGMKPVKRKDIRGKAADAGVRVFTARDYYEAAGRDENDDVRWFLSRFDREAPEYISQQKDPAAIENALLHMFGAYRHVLLGEAEGQEHPVKLRVPK